MQNQNTDLDSPHIVIVDDEPAIRDVIRSCLELEGYRISEAGDGAQLFAIIDRGPVHLITLDLTLGREDGLAVAREIRARSDVPIIMVTGKGDPIDRIVGLEIGADDYLPKPGNPRELLARLRAVLRRRAATTAAAPRPEVGVQQFGRCTLDHARRILVRDGVEQRLTSGEFALLSVLLRHAGQPLSRDRLMSLAHGRDHEPFERSIDVTVSRLRRMIEDDPKHPRHLQTVWGQGYVFVAD